MELKCDYCSEPFNRKPSEISLHNYCSRECYKKAIAVNKKINGNYNGGKYIKCVICGKKHYRTPSEIKKAKDHPTCSKKCFDIWFSENLIGEKASNYKNALLIKNCPVCGVEFTTYFKNQIYCSVQCRSIKQLKGKYYTCLFCGNSFYSSDSRGVHKYCSEQCKNNHFIGKNHPNYIKDRNKIKDQNKSIRESKKMYDWRKKVYERDNYTCQMCGNKSTKNNAVSLNAHHIERFIDKEELRFDINNGITLCETCHKSTYKKEDDFKKQFKELIYEQIT